MSSGSRGASGSRPPVGRLGLVALFVTALVTAQLAAAKVLEIGLPFELPLIGAAILVPGGVLAYSVTFFASDCYVELYGRREATIMINVGFLMNFVMLGLVWFALLMPISPVASPASQEEFAAVMQAGTAVVAGSLLAYLVSQNWDVFAFEWLRNRTDGRYLWLRNLGSTATSQAIDTVIFITVAFAVGPWLLTGEPVMPGSELLALILGQYLAKIAIAVGDTPFVYAFVRYVRETEFVGPRPTSGR